MKNLSFERLLDQRKMLSHIALIFLSLVVLVVFSLKDGNLGSLTSKLEFFLLLFLQLEAFIFIAGRIFKKLNQDFIRKDLTRIMLSKFFLFVIICFFTALIIFLLFRYAVVWINRDSLSDVLQNFVVYEFKSWFKSTVEGLSFGGVIFIVILWQDALKREQQLREENLVFQNETLKNQINPHFLFNSLNTISSLVQSQPDTAEKFINNLSLFYRYILENSPKDRVPLKAELDFINRYFSLYKIRDGEKIELLTDISDDIMYEIIPVSLQILVENAIKHNIATRENPLKISIFIEDHYLVVKNNLQRKASYLESTKIGLKNLAERVRLGTGKVLIIEENNDEFIVKLPLLI